MRLALAVLLLLAAPSAISQVIPDDFPTPGESAAQRNSRDLEERFLPFLSRLYAESDVAASPSFGDTGPVVATTLEVGYQMRSGDAVSVFGTLETEVSRALANPVVETPLGSGIGAQYVLALGRFARNVEAAQHAELGLAVSRYSGAVSGTSVEVVPRYEIGTGQLWSIVVGARVRRTFDGGDVPTRSWFVAPSVGVRLQYVSQSRMVLASEAATDPAATD